MGVWHGYGFGMAAGSTVLGSTIPGTPCLGMAGRAWGGVVEFVCAGDRVLAVLGQSNKQSDRSLPSFLYCNAGLCSGSGVALSRGALSHCASDAAIAARAADSTLS